MVKLYDINWCSHTAGPSPITNEFGPNCRIELFFMGCKKGAEGNPCPHCFNPKLWNIIPGCRELDPIEMAKHIEKFAPQPFITILGGEPFDQFEDLFKLTKELNQRNFHIIIFTHYNLITYDHPYLDQLLHCADMIIDGEYKEEERIYDESKQDGLHDAIGSGNQIIWDCKGYRESLNDVKELHGLYARDVEALYVTPNYELKYITKGDVPWVTLV